MLWAVEGSTDPILSTLRTWVRCVLPSNFLRQAVIKPGALQVVKSHGLQQLSTVEKGLGVCASVPLGMERYASKPAGQNPRKQSNLGHLRLGCGCLQRGFI